MKECVLVQGYSFMAPSILFKRNAVMDDLVQLGGGSERPGSAAVARSAMMKVRWTDPPPVKTLVTIFYFCLSNIVSNF